MDEAKTLILQYPNTKDKEADNEAGTLIYHSFNGLNINELLLTGCWVQIPHGLDECCDLEFSICAEDEDFFLADGVNVAIQQILVEHLHDDNEPDEQPENVGQAVSFTNDPLHQCLECKLSYSWCHLQRALQAMVFVLPVSIALNVFEELLRECAALLPMSLHCDLKNSK